MWEWMIYTAIFLLFLVVGYEYLRGRMIQEGFTDGEQHLPEFFTRFFPRRYDVVPGQEQEGGGWVRNTRYFEGYVDLQRFGFKGDFCRVVEKPDDPDSRIMACALAGQEGLDSLTFRTDSARAGMVFGRDDYFRDVNGDKRDDYCRIVKTDKSPADAWEARCVPAGITRFKQGVEIQDNEPPANITDLLWFYEGAMVWYRFFDDMLDYADNTKLKLAGAPTIDETPQRPKTTGLGLNRLVAGASASETQTAEQFLQVGENPRMEFDSVVDLRQLRAVSVWVYFDDFTNNARIFDFGNGPGKDNVFLGIQGKGNRNTGGGVFGNVGARPNPSNLVCQARTPEEVSPQVYMRTTDANVNEWTCPSVEPIDSAFPEDEFNPSMDAVPLTANLLFEIWDTSQRKMRVLVPDVFPLRKWTHVALTTTNMDLVMPTWHVYINGTKVYEHLDGSLPLKSYTQKNYVGRSNWEAVTRGYQDRDERFRGALFDFRLYRTPMAPTKIARTVVWGKERLQGENE